VKFKNNSEAQAIVGKLSEPSKMPCYAFSIPAWYCIIGAILHAIANSVCADCYALKNRFIFGAVKNAMERRYAVLMRALSDSVFRLEFKAAFKHLMRNEEHFRWHDSGDLQSVEHLILLAEIAIENPHVQFWLPTRERNMVLAFMRTHAIPDNLTIRVSAPMVDGEPLKMGDFPTSTVHKNGAVHGALCEAYTREGKCGPCRLCWDKSVLNVSYPFH
jgi:hypothetical protein